MKMKNIKNTKTVPDSPVSGLLSGCSSKICMVCGGKALGYNFNAVTCESCKAFFRRNALLNKEFTCPFSENCEITVVTRRFCQRCRLEKCFKIGMKKEYIMSEEDKVLKRRKIEQNRAKKRMNGNDTSTPIKIKRENSLSENEMCDYVIPELIHQQSSSAAFNVPSPTDYSNSSCSSQNINTSSPDVDHAPNALGLDSTPEEIVNKIVNSPGIASQTIASLMKTPKDAVHIMSKIINSQGDALKLISHFITAPGDALQIISKIMNSPLDALTVFAQFMSSPTDALQIISKIMSSPNDVLQFMQQLMNQPEDALQIMNKFMSAPAEALQIINKMMNHDVSDDEENDSVIKSMLQTPTSTSNCETTVPLESKPATNTGFFEDIESKLIEPNTIESILCQAIKLEYDGYNNPQHSNNSDLNDAERAKLNELIVANKALYAPVDEDLATLISDDCRIKSNQNQQDPLLLRVINLTAIAIRRLIKMSKKISAFKNMCQEDQLALLKGGCTEMMILRSVMQYDCDRATWKIPHSQEEMSSLKADVLKLAKGNVYQEHERFIQTFDQKWRSDENIILIMCAITLFSPDRPKTVHSDVIKLEQNSYYYLLRRYLESIYQGCEARSTFLKLMQKISELHKLNDEIISVYLDVNPSQVEPLLREIFDLKVH